MHTYEISIPATHYLFNPYGPPQIHLIEASSEVEARELIHEKTGVGRLVPTVRITNPVDNRIVLQEV